MKNLITSLDQITDEEINQLSTIFNEGLPGFNRKSTFIEWASDYSHRFPNITPDVAGMLFTKYYLLHPELRVVDDFEYWKAFVTLLIDNYYINL